MAAPASTLNERIVEFIDEPLPPFWIARPGRTERVGELHRPVGGIWETDASGSIRKEAVRVINSAREIVCLSSFLLADKEIVAALQSRVNERIRVYVLTASENRLKNEPREDSEFDLRVLEEHKALLDELAGRTLLRSGDSLHAKFVVIDPVSQSARGVLFTSNLTSEALTRNPEIAVSLSKDEANDLFSFFRWGFWRQSGYELFEPRRLATVKASPPFEIPDPERLPVTSTKLRTLRKEVERLAHDAEQELIVTSYGFDGGHDSTRWILGAAKRDVKVRVLARIREKSSDMGALIAMANAGVEVRGHPWLHAKCLLTNVEGRPEGLVMSANLEPHGMDDGFEAGILVRGEQATALKGILERWWIDAPFELRTGAKRGEIEGEVRLYVEETRGQKVFGKLDPVTILPEYRKDLGPTRVEPRFPPPEQQGVRKLYHRHVYTWTVPSLKRENRTEERNG